MFDLIAKDVVYLTSCRMYDLIAYFQQVASLQSIGRGGMDKAL